MASGDPWLRTWFVAGPQSWSSFRALGSAAAKNILRICGALEPPFTWLLGMRQTKTTCFLPLQRPTSQLRAWSTPL